MLAIAFLMIAIIFILLRDDYANEKHIDELIEALNKTTNEVKTND